MKYIFLDTNIFLHFKFFTEIPWHSLFGDPFQIVLAPVVVDELDKHKRHQNGKIASRARKVLSHFESIVNEPDTFPLHYLSKRPAVETFQKLQLDMQEQDDCVLAAIVEFSLGHSDGEIFLISNDTGPRFRAASLGIETRQLPINYQIPPEFSNEQKQIQKLTKENNQLKNAIPKLSLIFENGTKLLKAKLNPIQQNQEDLQAQLYRDALAQYPELDYENQQKKIQEIEGKLKSGSNLKDQLYLISQIESVKSTHLRKEQIETYNKKLNEFFSEYEKYLKSDYKYKQLLSLTLPVSLSLENNGNTPATDIDIWLHFPDGFKLLNEENFPDKPNKPKPPYKPKHQFDIGNLSPLSFPSLNPYRDYRNSEAAFNLNKPEIRETNSYEVDVHFENLKHFQSIPIDTLMVVFLTPSSIKSFKIDYKIIVGNAPEPFVGSLSVVIEKDE